MKLHVTIPGRPVPKGRPRFDPRTRRVVTPRRTRDYEKLVSFSAMAALHQAGLRLQWPLRARYRVTIVATYTDGRSWADADNLAKSCLDGCHRVLWDDDRLVDLGGVTRRLAADEAPRIDLIVEVLT